MDLNKWWSLNNSFVPLRETKSRCATLFVPCLLPYCPCTIQQPFVEPYNILGPILDMVLVLKELAIWSDGNGSLEFVMHT